MTDGKRKDKAETRESPAVPVAGELSPAADEALVAEHRRAHDEERADEFHREHALDDHPRNPIEGRLNTPLEPESPVRGKLAETHPLANAPTADELRSLGREVKPLVEPTDVPSDVYPHKIKFYGEDELRERERR